MPCGFMPRSNVSAASEPLSVSLVSTTPTAGSAAASRSITTPSPTFAVCKADVLDELLTDNLASLIAAGVLKLKAVAQDGVRVRASAGAASFRREEKLEALLTTARAQVAALKKQVDAILVPKHGARRQRQPVPRTNGKPASTLRWRVCRNWPRSRNGKCKKTENARASTTDADATVMKMGDGGFRPAFNIEFGSDTASQIIVGVNVVTTGRDMGQMVPMVKQVIERCG